MLNFELPKINAWLKSKLLSLNVNKTNFLFFTKTKEKIFPQINDGKLKQSNCVKCLGVFLDDKLTWKKHIEHTETKLLAASGAIYQLRKYIPQKALMSVFYSLMYSPEVESSRTSLASRTHFEVLGLGFEASIPR